MKDPPPAAVAGQQGHYAGAASRLAAFLADAALSSGLFGAGTAVAGFAIEAVTGIGSGWASGSVGTATAYPVWLLAYFAYPWAAFGKTAGMALLGVRVVAADGTRASGRRAVVRALALPLSIAVFGLGFAGVVLRRDRRALHDLIAGTAVVYSWDARTARLRFLAQNRQA